MDGGNSGKDRLLFSTMSYFEDSTGEFGGHEQQSGDSGTCKTVRKRSNVLCKTYCKCELEAMVSESEGLAISF